jgi:serine/threonine protein kinase
MVTELHPGDVLDGRFAIAELIGQGGMGSVFKATDLSTGCLVAVKMLFEVERDPVLFSRFRRETEIVRMLDHPGLLKILAVAKPGRSYLATGYVEGETLWNRLQRVRPLPVAEALRLATLICNACSTCTARGSSIAA